MNRRKLGHLAGVILVAAVLRWLLFPWVGIWGDYGFYIYDSRLILQGGVPFADFLGRSPLFNYSFAAVRAVFDNPIPLLRVWISTLWLATIVPVYLIGRHIRDHRTAIAASALFALTPFALVYGMWANTQSLAALLAAWGIYAVLRGDRLRWFGAAGFLFGLAYLSRRSVIVIAGAAGLYLWWRWYHDRDHRRVLTRSATLSLGFLSALAIVYGAMVSFDPGQIWALFEVHTLNLFFSYGRGSYPLISVDVPIVTNSVDTGRIPIFNDICQTCGMWTARTFAKTLLVTVPLAGLSFPYLRDITDRYFDRKHKEHLLGVIGVLALYAMVQALLTGFYIRALIIMVLLGFGVLAYRTKPLPRAALYDRQLQLVLAVLLALAAGYLYRNRVLHTYYFMDFWPYLSLVGGVTVVGLWDRGNRLKRALLAALLVTAIVISALSAHPLTVVALDGNDDGWFTMDNIRDLSDDIEERAGGDTVYATSPGFLSDTNVSTLNNKPRIHMVLVRYKDYGPAEPLYRNIIDAFRSGEAKYVIYSNTARQTMQWNDTAWQAFQENYCRVESADALYQRANAFLFKHQAQQCASDLRPAENMTLVAAEGYESPP